MGILVEATINGACGLVTQLLFEYDFFYYGSGYPAKSQGA